MSQFNLFEPRTCSFPSLLSFLAQSGRLLDKNSLLAKADVTARKRSALQTAETPVTTLLKCHHANPFASSTNVNRNPCRQLRLMK